METKELEAHLHQLDQTVLSLGNSIQTLRSQASGLYSQAQSYDAMASQLVSQAAYEEDSSRSSQMYSQAQSYISQAESFRMQAEQCEAEAEARCDQLRGYKGQYEYYMQMGQTHLAELQVAAQKLTGVAGSRYGSKLQDVLVATRNRIVYNQNLVNGCAKRISWIDGIAGSGGDSYQKVLRRTY